MILPELVEAPEINLIFTDFKNFGGILDFKIFKVLESDSQTASHLAVANKTLEELVKDNENYYKKVAKENGTEFEIYFQILYTALTKEQGLQITKEEFFGPKFNTEKQKPALLGESNTKEGEDFIPSQHYFYYDEPQVSENIVQIPKANESSFYIQGYTDAFLQPPHGFGPNNIKNLEIGEWFLNLNRFLYSDINSIIVYSWDINCSDYFDAGKEWWGSYFWTVYNPVKNWYIGITASTTD